ncbi:MAG: serine--tRNA ligase [Waddliaceae bacterium]|nr:serine--tRNA ligase [Waddliaceae bacterium]
MLDIKEIRENKNSIEELIQRKEPNITLDKVVSLDEEIRQIKTESEQLKANRKSESKRIGDLKRKGENADALMEEMKELGDKIQTLDEKRRELEEQFTDELSRIPNIPQNEIKISLDPEDNVEIKRWKEKPEFAFTPKNHLELNETLHLFDFKRTAKTTGSGWPCYRGIAARLEWALLSYMQEIHVKNGFEPWLVPHLVNYDTMYGSGQVPKFESQMFKIHDEDYHLYLIPTAEVVLNGMHRDEIIPDTELPIKYIATTPCFRREAGAAGASERGLIRVHQFNKVEMFCFAHPEDSGRVFDEMLNSAEEVLQGLELHYRNMLLVTGDMSFASTKTVDVEVWLPGQNRYYEVSSVSNCTDYQARRSNTRFRPEGGKTEFLHTLNGSGLATARLLVALLENNQQEDGSVHIPKVLRKYLGGESVISPRDLMTV